MDKRERFGYLDILKGLAIFLVVLQHVAGGYDRLCAFIVNCNIPIFFIVSGFLAYKENMAVNAFLQKKALYVFVPFTLSLVCFAIIKAVSIVGLVFDIGKGGYWFLLALFEIFILYVFQYYMSRNKTVVLFSLSIIIECLLLACAYVLPDNINNLCGISYLAWFYPCFMAGIFIRKMDILSISKYLSTILFALFVGCFLYEGTSNVIIFMIRAVGYFCCAVYLFFLVRTIDSSVPPRVSNMLKLWGRNSLSIYILHFYFIVTIGDLLHTPYAVVNLIEGTIISVVIIYVSLLLSEIISVNNLIGKILLGKK